MYARFFSDFTMVNIRLVLNKKIPKTTKINKMPLENTSFQTFRTFSHISE